MLPPPLDGRWRRFPPSPSEEAAALMEMATLQKPLVFEGTWCGDRNSSFLFYFIFILYCYYLLLVVTCFPPNNQPLPDHCKEREREQRGRPAPLASVNRTQARGERSKTHHPSLRLATPPLASGSRNQKMNLRTLVSQNKKRYQMHSFDLDLTYITDKVVAMVPNPPFSLSFFVFAFHFI
jgi:hypothetical protein